MYDIFVMDKHRYMPLQLVPPAQPPKMSHLTRLPAVAPDLSSGGCSPSHDDLSTYTTDRDLNQYANPSAL